MRVPTRGTGGRTAKTDSVLPLKMIHVVGGGYCIEHIL